MAAGGSSFAHWAIWPTQRISCYALSPETSIQITDRATFITNESEKRAGWRVGREGRDAVRGVANTWLYGWPNLDLNIVNVMQLLTNTVGSPVGSRVWWIYWNLVGSSIVSPLPSWVTDTKTSQRSQPIHLALCEKRSSSIKTNQWSR